MRSENENLRILHEGYQRKIDGLSHIYEELNFFIRNSRISQLIVSDKLFLKNFSPFTNQLFGINEGDIGKPINHIKLNLKYEKLRFDLTEVLNTQTTLYREVESNDGNWFQVTISPYLVQNNDLGGVFICLNNITELKRNLQEQESRIKHLELVNADLENFVYTASHDLMLPLNNIQSLTELLSDALKKNSSNTKSYLSMIKSAVQRFKKMLAELSDLGKIQAEILLGQNVVKFNDILDDLKIYLHEDLHATDATIELDLQITEVVFSAKNLRSILLNLIGNAIKYRSPERDPQIFISSHRLNGYIVLCVQDNGRGIKQEDIARIFEIYRQLDKGVKGSGIGLYLLNKIMHTAGGMVEVESEVGEGSIFKIYFKQ